jgi:hypothetical protein
MSKGLVTVPTQSLLVKSLPKVPSWSKMKATSYLSARMDGLGTATRLKCESASLEKIQEKAKAQTLVQTEVAIKALSDPAGALVL